MHILSKSLPSIGAAVVVVLTVADVISASAYPSPSHIPRHGHIARGPNPGQISVIGGGDKKRGIQKRASQEITSVIGCDAKGPLTGQWAMELYECTPEEM